MHLTLHATPPCDLDSPDTGVNLAQSVVSVAETFIHGELTPREEATFRESLHSPHVDDESHHLPGGLDPPAHSHPEEDFDLESDPSGVSLFASLLEHLLARFEFSAADTKIVIVHPGHSSFTLSIPEIAYGTDSGEPSGNTVPERSPGGCHRRTVSISGITVTSRDIRATSHRPIASPRTISPVSPTSSHGTLNDRDKRTPRPVSPASSCSSIDEETQMMMSQSIVTLPPRTQFHSSPSSSVISSMYQSAVSTTGGSSVLPALGTLADFNTGDIAQPSSRDHALGNRDTPAPHWATEDLIFSVGADPILIRLQTPSSYTRHDVAHAATVAAEGVSPPMEKIMAQDEALSLNVSIGVMACALRACHIRMLLGMLNYCGAKDASISPQNPEATPSSPMLPCGLHANLNIRGIVILLISDALGQEVPSLQAFFQYPLIPPRLAPTYLRVLLENVSGSLDLPGAPGNEGDASAPVSLITSNISLSNFSIFIYRSSRSANMDDSQVALPLLITDHHLHNQYVVSHCRPCFSSIPVPAQALSEVTLPVFEVVDWTAAKLARGSSKLSTWRVKSTAGKDQQVQSPSSKSSALPTSPKPTAALLSDGLSHSSALTFTAHVSPASARSGSLTNIIVRIAPLHVFFDVDIMLEGSGMLDFLDEVLASDGSPTRDVSDTPPWPSSPDSAEEEGSSSNDELDVLNAPSMTPRQFERERERKRLERLVLEDLDLDIDYRTGAPSSRQRPHNKRAKNTFKVYENVIHQL